MQGETLPTPEEGGSTEGLSAQGEEAEAPHRPGVTTNLPHREPSRPLCRNMHRMSTCLRATASGHRSGTNEGRARAALTFLYILGSEVQETKPMDFAWTMHL